MPFCGMCGKPAEEDSVFCVFCGARLESAAMEEKIDRMMTGRKKNEMH